MNPGVLYAALAFAWWGLFPLYFRIVTTVAPVEILAHRIVWSMVFLVLVLALRRQWAWLARVLRQPKVLAAFTISALLLASNWLTYLWAVNNGHLIDASLGYFINPLVNVLLGVAVLGERLNRWQWLAVAVAASGVAWLTLQLGAPPWIALALALSFGCYGLIRKIAVAESAPALGLESSILFVPAVMYLVWAESAGVGGFAHAGIAVDALLVGSGLVTALPLILFAYGAQRIPYSLVGILQYIAPSLQLACGVLLYGEPFTAVQAQGFACIWLALGIYAADGLGRLRRQRIADLQ